MRPVQLRKIKFVCIALGVMHGVAMIAFATGPELAPLMVYLVDAPVAFPLIVWLGVDETPSMWLSLIACSFAYPWVLYQVVRLLLVRDPGGDRSVDV